MDWTHLSVVMFLVNLKWRSSITANPVTDDFINDEKNNTKISRTLKRIIDTYRHDPYPSHQRKVRLYSHTGLFLKISKNGTAGGTTNVNAPEAVLELQSFGVSYRRIKSSSGFYLGINSNGIIKTTKVPSRDTLFSEVYNKTSGWLHYESEQYNYVLALKKNGKPRHGVKKDAFKKHERKCQFLLFYADQR